MEGKFSKLNQRENKSSRRLEMGGVNDTSINIGGNVIRSTITTGTIYSKGETRNSTGVNISNDITDQSVSTADVSTATSVES